MKPLASCAGRLVALSDVQGMEHGYKALPSLMRGDLWASMCGQRSFRFETAASPAVRFQAAGERTLVLFSAVSLRAWKDSQEQKKSEEAREKVTFGRLQTLLVHMQEKELELFHQQYPKAIFRVHLSAGQWIYIPAAWLVGERTEDTNDSFGFKVNFIDLHGGSSIFVTGSR